MTRRLIWNFKNFYNSSAVKNKLKFFILFWGMALKCMLCYNFAAKTQVGPIKNANMNLEDRLFARDFCFAKHFVTANKNKKLLVIKSTLKTD